MRKIILLAIIAAIFLANVSAAGRFLEETEIPQPTETKQTETPVDASKIQAEQEVNKDAAKEEQTQQKNEEKVADPVEQKEVPTEDKTEKITPVEEKNEQNAQEKEKVEEKKEEAIPVEEIKEKQEEVVAPEPKIEDEKNTNTEVFGLSIIFVILMIVGVFAFFVGFYRYSLQKYKIPPFSPPNFCPNFLFPRPENDPLMEDYALHNQELQGGIYSTEKYHNFF